MTVGRDDVVAWIRAFAGEVSARKEELTALDSAIGDADHGINMDRGMQAVWPSSTAPPTATSVPC